MPKSVSYPWSCCTFSAPSKALGERGFVCLYERQPFFTLASSSPCAAPMALTDLSSLARRRYRELKIVGNTYGYAPWILTEARHHLLTVASATHAVASAIFIEGHGGDHVHEQAGLDGAVPA